MTIYQVPRQGKKDFKDNEKVDYSIFRKLR